MASAEELAEMERMSKDYVPDNKAREGPLVGPLQSTRVLAAEYEKADAIYVNKTKALPTKYSHYRTVRGDGNCGWRALAFGYFEALFRIGDATKMRAEARRFREYNKILESFGHQAMIYDDFVDVTCDLLEATAARLPNSDGGAALLAAFNTLDSDYIVHHFRLITSTWMQSHVQHYADFVDNGDVAAYCRGNIDPVSIELEHVGLQALATAVINEAGLDIEVLYLDRSIGDEVTPHKMSVLDGNGNEVEGASTIRLLYRPGHYDLLYKQGDIDQMLIPMHSNVEVRRAQDPEFFARDKMVSLHLNDESYADVNSYLLAIPGFSMAAPLSSSPRPYSSYTSTSPTQAVQESLTTVVKTEYNTPPFSSYSAPPPTQPDQAPLSPYIKTENSQPQPIPKKQQTSEKDSPPKDSPGPVQPFRPTEQQLIFDYTNYTKSSAHFQEAPPDVSKKSETYHFANESFQPHIWRPGDKSRDSDSSTT